MKEIALGNLTINRDRYLVTVGQRRVDLTFKEFELAWCLAQSAERVISRQRLSRAVWGDSATGMDRALDVHLTRLRKKIAGSEPWAIRTVKKRGYVLTSQPGWTSADPSPSGAVGATSPGRRQAVHGASMLGSA